MQAAMESPMESPSVPNPESIQITGEKVKAPAAGPCFGLAQLRHSATILRLALEDIAKGHHQTIFDHDRERNASDKAKGMAIKALQDAAAVEAGKGHY